MGWLIDPDKRTVFAHVPNQVLRVFDQSEMRLPVPDFAEGLQLTVGELFVWLAD